ncbi:mechanosensitive ion channel family protein [Thiohalophilus sp.]|uniref:mechanosensitive ion channel family protein n=1 Tax=Thiohalophilus sp. TaxID=3028392 RepID=UPI003976161B
MQEYIDVILKTVNWEIIIFSALRILFILVVAWIAMKVIEAGLRRLEKRLIKRGRTIGEVAGEAEKRADTLVRLLNQAIRITMWAVVLLIILREVGMDIAPILASAGIVGLAVGFGGQNLVRDVISGFFILLENQVRVGDVAIVNGTGGLVEAVNFRTLILRDLSGVVHVFPNGTITTLSNMTREWSAYVFEIGVAYKENTDRVIDIMKQAGKELHEDETFGPLMIDDVEIFGVDQFGDSAVVIKGRLKTLPIKQWDVGREYRRRVKYAFDREGIEIPFPHRSIYFGEMSKPFVTQLINQTGQFETPNREEQKSSS